MLVELSSATCFQWGGVSLRCRTARAVALSQFQKTPEGAPARSITNTHKSKAFVEKFEMCACLKSASDTMIFGTYAIAVEGAHARRSECVTWRHSMERSSLNAERLEKGQSHVRVVRSIRFVAKSRRCQTSTLLHIRFAPGKFASGATMLRIPTSDSFVAGQDNEAPRPKTFAAKIQKLTP